MFNSLLLPFLLLCMLTDANPPKTQELGTLTVQVAEFRNAKGHLLVSLFNSKDYFPDNEEKAFRNKKMKITSEQHQVIFENVPYGEYAVIFLHDENDNEEMDTNFVGAPKEGYGASNDAVNTFSAPKYDEAKFTLNSKTKVLKLKVFY